MYPQCATQIKYMNNSNFQEAHISTHLDDTCIVAHGALVMVVAAQHQHRPHRVQYPSRVRLIHKVLVRDSGPRPKQGRTSQWAAVRARLPPQRNVREKHARRLGGLRRKLPDKVNGFVRRCTNIFHKTGCAYYNEFECANCHLDGTQRKVNTPAARG